MSTFNEQPNKENANKSSRQAQSQRSTLLFGAVPPRENTSNTRDVNQDITAISLSIDSPLYKIPTLTPQEADKNKTDVKSLKDSQLEYLEANQSLTQKAIEDAQTASKILAETKATQQALLEKIGSSSFDIKENNQKLLTIEKGMAQCEKILRESQFIHDEIENIHTKIKNQSTLIPSETHIHEINSFIEKLQNSQKTLEDYQNTLTANEAASKDSVTKINKELEICEKLRQELTQKQDLAEQQFNTYQAKITSLVSDAEQLMETSQNSLQQSKNSQTSYIALSREINALRQELQQYQKNTSNLSKDLESANKAIALNKVAVDALTTDMHNMKIDIKTQTKSTVFSNQEQDENKKSLEKLLEDTKNAHKKMSQLLQLNNAVNDRLTKIDSSVSANATKQEIISKDQEQALADINEQREACKRLIDQATRSHALIVAACKKTAELADQIKDTTEAEQELKNNIQLYLSDLNDKTKNYETIQNTLHDSQVKQHNSLTELAKTQKSLEDLESQNQQQLKLISDKITEVSSLSPELNSLKNETNTHLETLKTTLENYIQKSEELRQLQAAITKAHHIQTKNQEDLVKKIMLHIDESKTVCNSGKEQQERLEQLQDKLLQQSNNADAQSTALNQQLEIITSKLNENSKVEKDIEFSTTELRYLKEQCDSLVQSCMEQNQLIKKEENYRISSTKQLEDMKNKLAQQLECQVSREQELEQLNTIAQNALQDLNRKLDQFQQIQEKTSNQQEAIQQSNAQFNKIQQEQQSLFKQTQQAVAAVHNHLDAVARKEERISSLESKLNDHQAKTTELLDQQTSQIAEQDEIIKAQASLLDKVNETYSQTQHSLDTIEQIRLKAQQSFAHLGAQKTKFEAAFRDSLEKLASYDEKQTKQDALLDETKALTDRLLQAAQDADAYSQWQTATKLMIEEKLDKIDEYQSRAFQVQQSAQAREKQLESQTREVQDKLHNLDVIIQDLQHIRQEEAQYRDEMRALLGQHEQQYKEVNYKFNSIQDQHKSFSRSLEEAHLLFRENKVSTQESQMANRETKIILQEIQRELSQVKSAVPQSSFTQNRWDSEKRIDQLESRLGKSQASTLETENRYSSFEEEKKDKGGYNGSNFML